MLIQVLVDPLFKFPEVVMGNTAGTVAVKEIEGLAVGYQCPDDARLDHFVKVAQKFLVGMKISRLLFRIGGHPGKGSNQEKQDGTILSSLIPIDRMRVAA